MNVYHDYEIFNLYTNKIFYYFYTFLKKFYKFWISDTDLVLKTDESLFIEPRLNIMINNCDGNNLF